MGSMLDSSLRWLEFVMKLAQHIQQSEAQNCLTDAVLRREFCLIDKDMNGSLDLHELKEVFKTLEIPVDDSTLRKMLSVADADGNLQLEWAEFKRMPEVAQSVKMHEDSWSVEGKELLQDGMKNFKNRTPGK